MSYSIFYFRIYFVFIQVIRTLEIYDALKFFEILIVYQIVKLQKLA